MNIWIVHTYIECVTTSKLMRLLIIVFQHTVTLAFVASSGWTTSMLMLMLMLVMDDGYDDYGVKQNHSLLTGYHRRTKLVAARMDRRVPSVPLITDDHYDVANSTRHQSRHPRRNYPFDNAVVQTNLEGKMSEHARQNTVGTIFLTDDIWTLNKRFRCRVFLERFVCKYLQIMVKIIEKGMERKGGTGSREKKTNNSLSLSFSLSVMCCSEGTQQILSLSLSHFGLTLN